MTGAKVLKRRIYQLVLSQECADAVSYVSFEKMQLFHVSGRAIEL